MSAPVVEVTGLARRYPGPTPIEALHPTTLSIGAGEYVTLTGPSGSGKSTLLHLLSLLDRPSAGSYRIAGYETTTLTDAQRTALRGERIGFVFQAFHLLAHRTATENVMLALLYGGSPRAGRQAKAVGALAELGLGHRLDALPTALSGGERQRVAIARAIVTRPALLLADEPTGNLDSATSASVLAAFDELHRLGYTVVVATHDAQVAGRGTRRWRMGDGRLLDTGGGAR